jgi:hypothetical protein
MMLEARPNGSDALFYYIPKALGQAHVSLFLSHINYTTKVVCSAAAQKQMNP